MKKFGLLGIDQIECRQSRANEQSGVDILLYKTARTDANILDEVIGPENWNNDFKEIAGVLYGGIGIYFADIGEYIWKWDAGSESNIEQEKGQASDAFKRAGFKWGIGRELYTAPKIHFKATDVTWYKGKCYDDFIVTEIQYDENENICKLKVMDVKTGVAFVFEGGRTATVGGTKPKKDEPREEKTESAVPFVTEAQRKTLFELAKQLYGDKGADEIKRVMGEYGLTSTKEIRQDVYAKMMSALKKGA